MIGWRTLVIARRALTGQRRDRRALLAFLVVPVAITLLLAYVLRDADDDLTVGLVVSDDRLATLDTVRYLEQALDDDEVDTKRFTDLEAAEDAVSKSNISGYIVIDANLARDVLAGDNDEIRAGVDGSSLRAGGVEDILKRAITEAPLRVFQTAIGGDPAEVTQEPVVEVRYIHGGDEYGTFDHVVPQLMAFAVFFAVISSTLVAFTYERNMRTLERLLSTPLKRAEMVAGHVLGYAVTTLFEAAALIVTVMLVLRVHNTGDPGSLAVLLTATAFGALSLGIFCSAFARTEAEAMQFIALTMAPQLILSGVLFPLDVLPQALRFVAHALPLTYSVDALRAVMISDAQLWDTGVATDLAVLAGFFALFITLGVRTLGKETG